MIWLTTPEQEQNGRWGEIVLSTTVSKVKNELLISILSHQARNILKVVRKWEFEHLQFHNRPRD